MYFSFFFFPVDSILLILSGYLVSDGIHDAGIHLSASHIYIWHTYHIKVLTRNHHNMRLVQLCSEND